VVAQFNTSYFDPDVSDFVKIGQGSLGGKARSLAFMSGLLQEDPAIYVKYKDVNIEIPKTLVISTDGFESFLQTASILPLKMSRTKNCRCFLQAMPEWLSEELAFCIVIFALLRSSARPSFNSGSLKPT
jgi:hypothetical protein